MEESKELGQQLSKLERMDEIAREILGFSQGTILMNMRFMQVAFNRLSLQPYPGTIATDGQHLFYNPHFILQSYQKEESLVTRSYLHILLHCIFRHMLIGELVDALAWDTACDVVCEKIISEWNVLSFETTRSRAQAQILQRLQQVKPLTAETLYDYFITHHYSEEQLLAIREAFAVDDHAGWHAYQSNESGNSGQNSKNSNRNSSNGQGDSEEQESGSQNEGGSSNAESTMSDAAEQIQKQKALSEMWKNISEQMQLDLETFSKEQGDSAGCMVQNLKAVNRERYDYAAFLRKFAVLGEKMMVNDDEFDYIFYTYGLQHYKNMPLIEPLEYKEVKSIRDFVIAIDTSGSVMGDEVQSFITKTYNILKQQENFFKKINLHIIQCDAKIQEDAVITSLDQLDEYLAHMELHGFGGTDFRPVFSYVDKLIAEKAFTNLKGLIYFTDGYGDFPQRKPSYEVAFVFVNDDITDFTPEIPSWAIKLILTRNDLKETIK